MGDQEASVFSDRLRTLDRYELALMVLGKGVNHADEPLVVKGPPPPIGEPVAHVAGAEITAQVGVSRSSRPETATSFRDRSGWDRPGCTRQPGRSPCSARTAADSGGGFPGTGRREPKACHRAGPRRRGSQGAGL